MRQLEHIPLFSPLQGVAAQEDEEERGEEEDDDDCDEALGEGCADGAAGEGVRVDKDGKRRHNYES